MAAVWDHRAAPKDNASRTSQRAGAVAAIALHVIAGALLLSYEPARTALIEAAPIMVELITPPSLEKVQPPKVKPVTEVKPLVKPKPLPKPIEPPLVTAAPQAPSPVMAPPPPPAPSPAPVAATPAPAAPSAPVQAVATAPVAITPPIFNANYLENPAPPYPPQSQRMGEQGRVMLRVHVGVAGRAEEVQLRTSSGSRRLDESALETVKKWKFVPAKRGDQPVADWVLIPITFVWAPI